MRYYNCNSTTSSNPVICKTCGVDLKKDLFNVSHYSNRDIVVLLIYIGWVLLMNILFTAINRFVIPDMILKGLNERISYLMSTFDLIISSIDILIMILLILFAKSNLIKRSFTVYLFVRITLFILNRANI